MKQNKRHTISYFKNKDLIISYRKINIILQHKIKLEITDKQKRKQNSTGLNVRQTVQKIDRVQCEICYRKNKRCKMKTMDHKMLIIIEKNLRNTKYIVQDKK